MKTVEVVIPYKPRVQFVPFHNRSQRWGVLVVHRRAGKTVAAINELVKKAMLCPLQSPRFGYVAPTYAQAKDVAWSYLKRFTDPIPGRVVSEAELHVTLPGDRRIRLYGADNYDRMRGVYFDGVVVDEPADMDAAAWYDVLRPALSDRQGWCVWIGTPKGRDAFYRLWKDACANPDWFVMRLPASESGILPVEELESAKQGMKSNAGAYDREYECSFETPVAGSVYGDLLVNLRTKGRIRPFEWNRSFPVFSSWDLGWNDCTSVWLWQVIGPEIHWLWHTRQRGKTAADMATLVRASGIPVAMHFLPHDADSANAATGLSYRQALAKAGFDLQSTRCVNRTANIWDGINYARDLLPRSWFRLPDCELGLEALEAYHTKEVTSGSAVSKEPVHDWSSHDADSFRTAAEALVLGLVRANGTKLVNDVLGGDSPSGVMNYASLRERGRGKTTALSGFKL